MKPTFLTYEKPLLTVILQCRTPEVAIGRIKKALAVGGEAFGLQTECLLPEYRNPETYRKIFAAMDGKPIYVTCYREKDTDDSKDHLLAQELITLAENGATLCDIPGDLFGKHPEELTENEEAIAKQMELVEKLHSLGAEVLMSSHILKFRTAEQVLQVALEQQRRGADVVKIVTNAETMEQQVENLRIVTLLKEKLSVPFLFLSGGECGLLRRIGPNLGCCMYLCVYEHDELSAKKQPLLEQVKAIRDNMPW